VYVPIGLGSGIAGMIAVRNALKLDTEIVGVVAKNANAYRLSFDAGKAITADSAATLADGLAVRKPDRDALEYILNGVARVVEVSEQDLNVAIKAMFLDTHNVSEGAGAASLAGLMKEKDRQMGKRVSIILSGGNIDTLTLVSALSLNS
jgi:threonine dehydratase